MQGVAFFFVLGVGIATAAFLYFLTEQERRREQPHRSSGYSGRTYDDANSQHTGHRSSESSFRGNQPSLSGSTQKCVICQENISVDRNLMILRCGHYFHKNCIDNWFQVKKECPHCRRTSI